MAKFIGFPSAEQWKKSTFVFGAFRSSDKVLAQIDDLVALYWSLRESRYEIMYQLYRVTLYWIKNVGIKFKGNEKRMEVVAALNFFIRDQFKKDFHLGEAEFDDLLLALFGKPVHVAYEDTEVFNENRSVEYIKEETVRRKFKVVFRKGLAYKRNENGLQLYDTSTDIGKQGEAGEAIFVMDDKGRIYTGSYAKSEFHHSSFLAGGWSMAAGVMRITNGQVVSVCPDSGHYQPGLQQMLNVVERLRTYGVNLQKLTVKTFIIETSGQYKGQIKWKGGSPVWDLWRGDEFLMKRGIR